MLNTLLGRTKRRKTQKGKKTKAKGKKSKAHASRAKARGTKPLSIDVRDKNQVGKLAELLKEHKVVLVLVYADWCGHCQTFKKDVWSKLSTMPNRKVPMAQVNADVLDETSLPKENVDGYPTVMVVGNDGKATNIDDSRNLSMMKSIASADTNKMLSGVTEEPEDVNEEGTPEPANILNFLEPGPTSPSGAIATVKRNMKNSGLSMGTTLPTTITPPNPPSVEDDLLMSQESPSLSGNSSQSFSFSSSMNSPYSATGTAESNASGASGMIGGSLFAALSEAAKGAFAPALLASVAMTRRRRGGGGRRRTRRHRRAQN